MPLVAGTPAPLFSAPSPINPRFAFGSLGGRWIVLGFLPGPGPERDAALAFVRANATMFETPDYVFFGVVPDEKTYQGLRNEGGMRWFADFEGDLRRLYEVTDSEGDVAPQWVVVDPSMRILGSWPLPDYLQMFSILMRHGPPDRHAGVPLTAPILIVPRVFESDLCRQLIDYYEAEGGEPSGIMREIDGRTVGVMDPMKSRRDRGIADEALVLAIRARLRQRLMPEIAKAFCFDATRIERYIVARYNAEEGGYFRPHRDNTSAGTAHRRFAVSINLNADFDGGDLRFPEFGSRTYRPPIGGAVVFGCSLLHEATPVTRGTRFACLPFLYDEAGAAIRERNLHLVGPAPESAPVDAKPLEEA